MGGLERRSAVQAIPFGVIAATVLAGSTALAQPSARPPLPPPAPDSAAVPSAQTSPPLPAPPDTPDPRGAALQRFEKGKAMFKSGLFSAALAEFLESRKLYSTRNATNNAALCLTELGRFDEALDMYEALLKEFPDSPEDVRLPAEKEVLRLRGLVGTIDVTAAEVGAAISIDGRARGAYPPVSPLRVTSGSHLVRVNKEGFVPFEGRVDVAGGDTVRVAAVLRPHDRPGQAHVTPARATSSPELPPANGLNAHGVGLRVAAGAGLSGLVTAGLLAVITIAEKDTVERECTKIGDGLFECSRDGKSAADRAQGLSYAATVALGLGLAGLGTTGVLYLTLPKPPPKGRTATGLHAFSAALAPLPGAGAAPVGAFFAVSGAW